MVTIDFFLNEDHDFDLSYAIVMHDELNPKLFENEKLKPHIREGLLKIAKHFEDFIGIPLDIEDITISGSNAAYSYTPHSDLDLHIVVNVPEKIETAELLDAKKNVYNARHDIKIKGIDVELYAQDSKQEHHSLGIYSVLNDEWIEVPEKQTVEINLEDATRKYNNYVARIETVLKLDSIPQAEDMWKDIRRMRQAGLDEQGEFGLENIVFKALRSQGWIGKLATHINNLKDDSLSIEGVVNEKIGKVKAGYRLYSKSGKNLGTYPTKAGAEKRERQVRWFARENGGK